MAYPPQTWIDDDPRYPASAARMRNIEEGIRQAHLLVGASAVPRLGPIVVASRDAPAEVRSQAFRTCTGTNDQDFINEALRLAARGSDLTGGTGAGVVELVGPNFFVGQNNTGVIQMQPATWLRGSGFGTVIQPMHGSYTGLGAIQLVNTAADHTHVSDLTIGRIGGTAQVHGIKYVGNGASSSSDVATGNDPFQWIHHVVVLATAGAGIRAEGTGGGARALQVDSCVAWESGAGGFVTDGSSDSHMTNCNVQPRTGPGFQVGGGNSKLLNCKSYYSDGSSDGFLVTSSRPELIGCSAQDNGRWGFNVSSQNATMSGCVADSNARSDTGGGGFNIAAEGMFEGLHAHDRAQSTNQQMKAFQFTGSPQVYLTGRAVVPTGGTHVTGTAGANSFVRIVRDGTTIFAAG